MSDKLIESTLQEQEAAVQAFCRFLQFETVSSTAPLTGAYRECATWLLEQCQALGKIPTNGSTTTTTSNGGKKGIFDDVFLLPEAPEHSPVVVAVWKGLDESLPVILLNSHYDVVPADRTAWTVEPFAAVQKDGRIYGRGAQDMKCVCIQYLQAIAKIHSTFPDWKPARSIYLTFVPDEEVGGSGMAAFLESKTYLGLPGIALALDEGLASETDGYSVFYGERLPWWVDVTATGPTGHGSRFIEHTAVEQLIALANKALEFRSGQRAAIGLDDHSNCAHAVAAASKKKTLGDVTSLNITSISAGVPNGAGGFVHNCVPPTAKCSLDIRISPNMEPSAMKDLLDSWCRECSSNQQEPGNAQAAGSQLTWKFAGHHNDSQQHATTSTNDAENPWYAVFSKTIQEKCGITLTPQVFPAATDSRFLRALGIRALGFSPMRNSEIMLHENDEYIDKAVFLEGVSVYVSLIHALGSQGSEVK